MNQTNKELREIIINLNEDNKQLYESQQELMKRNNFLDQEIEDFKDVLMELEEEYTKELAINNYLREQLRMSIQDNDDLNKHLDNYKFHCEQLIIQNEDVLYLLGEKMEADNE